ncbi:MAG TPA: AsmA-like C-terminal domain-containing protein, partial [Dongiaceae bacterium]
LKATGTLTAAQEGLMEQGATGLGPDMRLNLRMVGTNIPVGPLSRYWPRSAGTNARDWVTENMTAGMVEKLEADMALHVPEANWSRAEVDGFLGKMQAKDLTIHYLRPMPPIEGASGNATFTLQAFTVDFGGGTLQGLNITGGKLAITGLDQPRQTIEVNGKVTGSVPDALALLDNERLGYISKLGIDVKSTKGKAQADLAFKFPADKDLTFDQVELTANADLADVAVGKAMLERDFTDGALKLSLDRHGMKIAGKGKFAAIPIDLEWHENFEGKYLRRIAAKGTVDSAQRKDLGFDYSKYLDGPVATDLTYTVYPKKRATLAAKLDLAEGTVAVDLVNWRKPAGVPGAGSFEMDFVDGNITAIRDLAVAAGDLVANGQAEFSPESGKAQRLELSQLNVGRTRLTNVITDFSKGYPDVTVGGGIVDAAPLLAHDDKPKEPGAEEPTPAFAVKAPSIAKAFLQEGRELTNLSLQLRHDEQWWDLIDMKATVPNSGELSVRYGPVEGGRHELHVNSADAGAVLAVFGISQSVRRGTMIINAAAEDAAPGRPLKGVAEIKDFRVVDAPVLARILTMATFTGFIDMASGEGFQFDKFKGEFTKTEGRLDIEFAKAHGPSIGITAAGHVDFDKNSLRLAGTVIPVNAVNSVLSDIPILGDIFFGEGMFAVTYGAQGSLDNPEISVNPLSAIAPGFIKGLFDYSTGDEPPPRIQALPQTNSGGQR